jgi:TolB-like protein/DNA-binding winged helix-turn-helix (wHTH) protein
MTSRKLKIGDWTATPALNVLESAKRSVEIEPRAMDLLMCLAEHHGEVLSTSQLIAEVWGGRVVGDHSVYRLIQQLRTALGDDSNAPRYIATVTRRGYRLIAPVEPVHDHTLTAGIARSRRLFASDRVRLLVAAFALVALGVAGVSLGPRLAFNGSYDGESIAVLPFTNLSSSEDNDYLGDGIAGEIIHALSNGSGLRVIARTSSFSFRESAAAIPEIAAQLGASVVLEGSVRRENDRLRVIAQLIDAESGDFLWSESFDRSVDELITVERTIALAIAERLMGTSADATRIAAALPPVENIAAYELYLLGRERMRIPSGLSREWSRDDAEQAAAYFRRAVAADPNFARAHAGLADALLQRAVIGRGVPRPGEIPDAVAEEALAAIEQAEMLEPMLAETRVSRGLAARVLEQNDERAFELYREAVELDPNFVRAYYHLARGVQGDEGIAALQKAVELDPLSAELHLWLARLLRDNERSGEASPHLQVAMQAANPPIAAFLLAATHSRENGRTVEAIRLLERLLSDSRFEAQRRRVRHQLTIDYLNLGALEHAEASIDRMDASDQAEDQRIRLDIARGRLAEAAERVHRLRGHGFAALWELLLGHDDHALAEFDALGSVSDDRYFSDLVGWGYHTGISTAYLQQKLGRASAARAALDAASREIEPLLADVNARGGAYYLLASRDAILGNTDAALAALEQAVASGWQRTWYAERDPVFDDFRGDPRYESLITRMRARQTAQRELL